MQHILCLKACNATYMLHYVVPQAGFEPTGKSEYSRSFRVNDPAPFSVWVPITRPLESSPVLADSGGHCSTIELPRQILVLGDGIEPSSPRLSGECLLPDEPAQV